MTEASHSLFDSLRVLELAGELGAYTGKLFADLGADVIRIEPLAGDPTRQRRPFFQAAAGRENSLRYQYLNTNKKAMALDLTDPAAGEILRRLIRTADLCLESYPPGYLDRLGLGYENLSQINPRLVHTAITPYGQSGPYKDYPYSDLTSLAMGGMLYLAGIEAEKPARVPDNQSFFQADLYAAYASIVALYHADATEEGQFVDVSIQESVTTALENAIQTYDLEGRIRRAAGSVEAGYGAYACQDGYVYVMAAMGRNAYLWDPLVQWMAEKNIPEAEILAEDRWKDPEYRKLEEAKTTFKRIFETFSRQYRKEELYEESQKRKVVIYPVNSAKDVLENPQLAHRSFFKHMYVASLGSNLCYPGAPYALEKMVWQLRAPAPVFGQDTAGILGNLGYGPEEIQALVERGVAYVR